MAVSLTQPPKFRPDAVLAPNGWVDPVTGEVLIAIKKLDVKAAAKNGGNLDGINTATLANVDIAAVPTFTAAITSADALAVGDKLKIDVTASEAVGIDGIATIRANIAGNVRDIGYTKTGSTSTLLKFEYTTTAEDTCDAGDVTITPKVISSNIYDQVLGLGRKYVAQSALTFAALNSAGISIGAGGGEPPPSGGDSSPGVTVAAGQADFDLSVSNGSSGGVTVAAGQADFSF